MLLRCEKMRVYRKMVWDSVLTIVIFKKRKSVHNWTAAISLILHLDSFWTLNAMDRWLYYRYAVQITNHSADRGLTIRTAGQSLTLNLLHVGVVDTRQVLLVIIKKWLMTHWLRHVETFRGKSPSASGVSQWPARPQFKDSKYKYLVCGRGIKSCLLHHYLSWRKGFVSLHTVCSLTLPSDHNGGHTFVATQL